MVWKVWGYGIGCEVTTYVNANSFDEAIFKARQTDSRYSAAQIVDNKENKQNGAEFVYDSVLIPIRPPVN